MSATIEELVRNLTNGLLQAVDEKVAEAVKPLQDEIAQLEAQLNEWVDTREAMRLTGIRQAETLKAERERPGTVLRYKFEGTTGKLPRYSRASIAAYNLRKEQRRIPSHSLLPRTAL